MVIGGGLFSFLLQLKEKLKFLQLADLQANLAHLTIRNKPS
jgi:hypothetical protein